MAKGKTTKKKRRAPSIQARLKLLLPEIETVSAYDMADGIFLLVARSCFVKAYEFTRYCNSITDKRANEGSFFAASGLRGICEDVIVLRFLHRLAKADRDEAVGSVMVIGTNNTITEQRKFFGAVRPFQPVLAQGWSDSNIAKQKEVITNIGKQSGYWKTEGKLPPVEQMAIAVGMREIYDYFYRVTSASVHFNPGVALRNGWGNEATKGHFATKNFCRYYLFISQVYSIFLLNEHCTTLKEELALSDRFLEQMQSLMKSLNQTLRWPEAITFEEMNQEAPNIIVLALLRVAHDEGLNPKTVLKETLPHLGRAADEMRKRKLHGKSSK